MPQPSHPRLDSEQAIRHWRSYYDRTRYRTFEREQRFAELLLHHVSSTRPVSESLVLDMACGYGHLLHALNSVRLTSLGIDLNHEMLEIARSISKNDDFVSLVQADVLALPLPNGCCDAACSVGLLEHFTEHELRERLLPELRRVLRKDGVVLVHVPVRSVTTRLVRFWRRRVSGTLSSDSIDDDNDPTHRIWWSSLEYRQLLSDCGFAVLSAGHYPYRSSREPWLFSLGTTMLHDAATAVYSLGLPVVSWAAERLLSHTAFASYYIARPYEVL